jgi:hypothetical protein
MTKINLEEINSILSDTIHKVLNKEMPLKQASVIARLTATLSKNIANTELKDRVEFLESVLRKNKDS